MSFPCCTSISKGLIIPLIEPGRRSSWSLFLSIFVRVVCQFVEKIEKLWIAFEKKEKRAKCRERGEKRLDRREDREERREGERREKRVESRE